MNKFFIVFRDICQKQLNFPLISSLYLYILSHSAGFIHLLTYNVTVNRMNLETRKEVNYIRVFFTMTAKHNGSVRFECFQPRATADIKNVKKN